MSKWEFYTEKGKKIDLVHCSYAVIYEDYVGFVFKCIKNCIITDGLTEMKDKDYPIVLAVVDYDDFYRGWQFVSVTDYPEWLVNELAKRQLTTMLGNYTRKI